MALTASSKQLVSESLKRIQPHSAELVIQAYRLAFKSFPELEARFETRMGQPQGNGDRPPAWSRTFAQCLDSADSGAALLIKLGQMHAAHGAQPGHVEGMLSFFVDAVALFDREHWSVPLEQAWREFMAHVGFHVNEGLRQAA
jgi:hemoglobin-like flavoprotein